MRVIAIDESIWILFAIFLCIDSEKKKFEFSPPSLFFVVVE